VPGDQEMETLVQRGDALIKSAKWFIPEDIHIQHPGLASGLIVGTTNSGKIEAFDAATGQKKWEKESGGTAVSIIRIDGDLVITQATSAPHAVSTLNLSDGSEKWGLDLPDGRMQVDVNGPWVTVGVNLSKFIPPMRGPARLPTREAALGPAELRTYAWDTGKLLWT
jgi:hypothetical protein